MLELLVVFALASIGVYFTTTDVEPRRAGNRRADYDEYDESFDDDDEDSDTIGIFGLDVARKSKARKLIAARRIKVASEAALDDALEDGRAGTSKLLDDADLGTDSADGLASESDSMSVDDQEIPQDETLGASIRSVMGDYDYAAASAAWRHDDPKDGRDAPAAFDPEDVMGVDHFELDRVTSMVREDDEVGKPRPYSRLNGQLIQPVPEAAAKIVGPGGRRREIPVIEDFDPKEDKLMIGYLASEVGDGHVGISEDPRRPGTARVMLGGKVVALVRGAYGVVSKDHIELYQIDQAA